MRLIFVLLLLVPILGNSQICFRIDSIYVYDMIETEPVNVIDEYFGDGPSVHGYFSLINNTEDTFIITQPYCTMCFYYEYGMEEQSGLYLYASIPNCSYQLLPCDTLCFDGGSLLMLDRSLHKSKKLCDNSFNIVDHTDVFFQILPTLYAKLFFDDEFVTSSTYSWSTVDTAPGNKVVKLIPQDSQILNNK